MKKYSVKVSVRINGVRKEMVVNNVYAKNEGHAGYCAMERVSKIKGYECSSTSASDAKEMVA